MADNILESNYYAISKGRRLPACLSEKQNYGNDTGVFTLDTATDLVEFRTPYLYA